MRAVLYTYMHTDTQSHIRVAKHILLFYAFVRNHKCHRMRKYICKFAYSHKVMIEGRFRIPHANIRIYSVRQINGSTLLLSADCHTFRNCCYELPLLRQFINYNTIKCESKFFYAWS